MFACLRRSAAIFQWILRVHCVWSFQFRFVRREIVSLNFRTLTNVRLNLNFSCQFCNRFCYISKVILTNKVTPKILEYRRPISLYNITDTSNVGTRYFCVLLFVRNNANQTINESITFYSLLLDIHNFFHCLTT